MEDLEKLLDTSLHASRKRNQNPRRPNRQRVAAVRAELLKTRPRKLVLLRLRGVEAILHRVEYRDRLGSPVDGDGGPHFAGQPGRQRDR